MARFRAIVRSQDDDGAAPRVEAAGALPGSQEGVLGDVLGQARIAHDPHRDPEDPPLEALDERRGRVGITRGQAVEQRIVGNHPHGRVTARTAYGIAAIALRERRPVQSLGSRRP